MDLIGDGVSIDHALWNELFTEFDAKISKLMDGKTWLLARDPAVLPLMGVPFFFVQGDRPQTAWLGGLNYDHAKFSDLAASIAAATDTDGNTLYDPDKKILKVVSVDDPTKTAAGVPTADLFFDHSLQAHRRLFKPAPDATEELYWLLEDWTNGFRVNATPQKIYRFALAELVVEGRGLVIVQLQPTWDKFNFFRLHNCNPVDVTFDFAGYFSVTVPRWGVQTVRRSTVSSGYELGGKFFHNFRSGDPRLFEMPQSNSSPVGSQGANNVVCPSIVYRVVSAFSGAQGLGGSAIPGPKLYSDPIQVPDVSDTHTGYFPATGAR